MAGTWTPSARLKRVALERAQPLSASLELTYRCNWRCVFCYNPRHFDRRGLDGDEWIAVLDGLRALGTLWLGGGHIIAASWERAHLRQVRLVIKLFRGLVDFRIVLVIGAAQADGEPRHRWRRPDQGFRAAAPRRR